MSETKGTLKAETIRYPRYEAIGVHVYDYGPFELNGKWPVECTREFLYMETGKHRHEIGDVIELHPYRVRVIDEDIRRGTLIVTQDAINWRWPVYRIRASRAWKTFIMRIRVTLYVWGLVKNPSNGR